MYYHGRNKTTMENKGCNPPNMKKGGGEIKIIKIESSNIWNKTEYRIHREVERERKEGRESRWTERVRSCIVGLRGEDKMGNVEVSRTKRCKGREWEV